MSGETEIRDFMGFPRCNSANHRAVIEPIISVPGTLVAGRRGIGTGGSQNMLHPAPNPGFSVALEA